MMIIIVILSSPFISPSPSPLSSKQSVIMRNTIIIIVTRTVCRCDNGCFQFGLIKHLHPSLHLPFLRNKAYYRHFVLSYKEHVQALVAFKPTKLSQYFVLCTSFTLALLSTSEFTLRLQ